MSNCYTEESGRIYLAPGTTPENLPEHLRAWLGLLSPQAHAPGNLVGDEASPTWNLTYALHSEGDTIHVESDAAVAAATLCATAGGMRELHPDLWSVPQILDAAFAGSPHAAAVRQLTEWMHTSDEVEPTAVLKVAMLLPGGEAITGFKASHAYYSDRMEAFSAGGSCSFAVRRPDGTIAEQTVNPHDIIDRQFARLAAAGDTQEDGDTAPCLHVRVLHGAVVGAFGPSAEMKVIVWDEDRVPTTYSDGITEAIASETKGLHELALAPAAAIEQAVAECWPPSDKQRT